jgi:hypothetical protein
LAELAFDDRNHPPEAADEARIVDRRTEESNAYQYRFEHLVDVDSIVTLFEIEHEIRSTTHPLYARPLVNRNPAHRASRATRWAPTTGTGRSAASLKALLVCRSYVALAALIDGRSAAFRVSQR